MRLPALAAVVVTALALPGQALAGTVTRTDAAITYTADPAAAAREEVVVGTEGGSAFVQSTLGATSADCTQTDANRVDCDPAAAFVVNLLDFDDSVAGDLVTTAAALEAHGGAG